MAIELYHAGVSVCSEKVRIGLAEKGQAFTSHLLDLRSGDQQNPDYLKLNPNAVVPTLLHDGNVLIESNVINEYIAEVFPGTPLTTSDPLSRARMRVWSKQLDESIHQYTSVISSALAFRYQMLSKPREEVERVLERIPDPARRERQRDVFLRGVDSDHFAPAIHRFARMLRDMQTSLEQGAWLAGEDFSLADIAFAPYVTRLDQLQLSWMWDKHPAVADWYDRVRARPSYAAAYEGWLAKPVVDVMREKGREAKARVRQILGQ